MPRKKLPAPPQPPPITQDDFSGLAEVIPEVEKDALVNDIARTLRDAIKEGDLNKARLANVAIATIKKGVGDRDGLLLKADQRWIDGIHRMAISEFSVPSQLAEYDEELRSK